MHFACWTFQMLTRPSGEVVSGLVNRVRPDAIASKIKHRLRRVAADSSRARGDQVFEEGPGAARHIEHVEPGDIADELASRGTLVQHVVRLALHVRRELLSMIVVLVWLNARRRLT